MDKNKNNTVVEHDIYRNVLFISDQYYVVLYWNKENLKGVDKGIKLRLFWAMQYLERYFDINYFHNYSYEELYGNDVCMWVFLFLNYNIHSLQTFCYTTFEIVNSILNCRIGCGCLYSEISDIFPTIFCGLFAD